MTTSSKRISDLLPRPETSAVRAVAGPIGTRTAALLDTRLIRRILFSRLERIGRGMLVIEDADGRHQFGARGGRRGHADRSRSAAPAVLSVHDPRAYRLSALGGSVGAAEGYMAGCWTTDDLYAVMRLFADNADVLDELDGIATWLPRLRYRFSHWRRKNTRAGSSDNIYAHYDLGVDFFAMLLDETLTYSCGIFESAGATLGQAQIVKLDRICKKLALRPCDRVLEIGTGWGSFALHAASRYGCRVTSTTISEDQLRIASERVRRAGLDDRITLLDKDYRDLTGTYDKLVSIEMIEAVGHEYLDDFFAGASDRLAADGIMVLQAITMADQRYEYARRQVDFIRQYVFPGSVIPSITAMVDSATRATDMRLFHLEDITSHYAETLARWRQRYHQNLDRVRALGHDERFIKLWDYYLAYCQAGFASRYIGNVQMAFGKPRYRPTQPSLPPL